MSKPRPKDICSILFVCTGNICRSPLAEYFFSDYVEKQGASDRFDISSAGTFALRGNRATYEALEAGRRRGLDLRPHRARPVDQALLSRTDHILVMTRSHHDWLCRHYPGLENKIYLAKLFPRRLSGEPPEITDVPDPYGESVGYYLEVLEMLEPVLPKLFRDAIEEDHQ
ncbi:MAG: arsenate reductase/protein-tyrosine-phosphatase family protein [Thermoleophilia bacterium]